MDGSDYVNALVRDGRAFADAATGALDADVAACPEWDMADLVWHLGEVHYFWRTIAAERLDGPDVGRIDRPGHEVLLSWYHAGLDELVNMLTHTDPDTEVWTWSPQKNVGFIRRRMAQETAVHRWDAEEAAGRRQPIETRLAVDGIDEFLTFMLPDARKGAEPVGGSVHLHCTDVDGEWIVREDGDTLAVTPEHAKGDAAIRGSASDLLLLLWRRVPLEAVEVLGDADVAARFIAHTDLD